MTTNLPGTLPGPTSDAPPPPLGPAARTDRDARGDDQKAAREVYALRMANGVDRLPGDEHYHDGRLPCPCGEF